MISAAEHCGACGTSHQRGTECPDGAFAHFECSKCSDAIRLPVDCLGYFGDGMCGCGTPETQWKRVSADRYRQLIRKH